MSTSPGLAPPAAANERLIAHRMANRVVMALGALVLFAPADANIGWPFVVAALLIAVPASMAERMLATRSARPMISGLQQLTREADASTRWRLLAWSGLAASFALAVIMALLAAMHLMQIIQMLAESHSGLLDHAVLLPLLSVLLLWLGGLRSLYRIPVLFWLIPLVLTLAALLLQLSAGVQMPMVSDLFQIPGLPSGLAGVWGVLALCGGAGVIWSQAPTPESHAPRAFWQVAIGIGVLGFVGIAKGPSGIFLGLLSVMVALLAIKVCLEPLRAELAQRGRGGWQGLLLMLVPATLAVEAVAAVLDQPRWLTGLLVMAAWLIINMLITCLFAGWVVKVSHARKALRFPSETLYTAWRVLVRWVAPIGLALLLAQLLAAWP